MTARRLELKSLWRTGQPHRLEGRSLLPLLRAEAAPDWRDAAFSETDYAWRAARLALAFVSTRRRRPSRHENHSGCATNDTSCTVNTTGTELFNGAV